MCPRIRSEPHLRELATSSSEPPRATHFVMSPESRPAIQQRAQSEILMNKITQLAAAFAALQAAQGMAPPTIAPVTTSTITQNPIDANTTQTAANHEQPQGTGDERHAGRGEEPHPQDQRQQPPIPEAGQPSSLVPLAEKKYFAMMQDENDLQASVKLDQMNQRIMPFEALLQAATASMETMSDRASTAGRSRTSDKERNEEM